MDHGGHELFSSPGLPDQQYCGTCSGHLLRLVQYTHKCRAFAHDLVMAACYFDFLLQIDVVALELLLQLLKLFLYPFGFGNLDGDAHQTVSPTICPGSALPVCREPVNAPVGMHDTILNAGLIAVFESLPNSLLDRQAIVRMDQT